MEIYTDSFLEDIRSLAARLTNSGDSERDAFVKMIYKFEKISTPKLGSADTFHCQLKIKPHKTFIRKTYPVTLAHRESVEAI